MTKQDRIHKLNELVVKIHAKFTKKLDSLNAEIKAIENENERWRAEKNEKYFSISRTGNVQGLSEDGEDLDNNLFEIGNYYQTEEQAKLGPEYFHANSEYTFWHPGMESRPKEIPEGCEAFFQANSRWEISLTTDMTKWTFLSRRWPKTSPVEWVKS